MKIFLALNSQMLYINYQSNNCWHFSIYEHDKFYAQLSRALKKNYEQALVFSIKSVLISTAETF